MDNLRGSETFGDPKDNSKAWAKVFDGLDVSAVRITSLHGNYVKYYDHNGRRIINRLS